ncbi:chloramphenicol acetyltransferase [Methylobacterium nigriterrae]|uniref:chloramphenicol acetyltransferase n=1 Tax=Methylobacterium nigriterrae TaxID=3127512 RepID=UPI0030133CAB
MAADRLGLEPVVDPTARILRCRLGRYTEVGARTRLTETSLDDYSYIVEDGEAIYARIGKFCSIAAQVRINPGNHPVERASQAHFTYRAKSYWPEEENEAAFFERRRARPVTLGHDVWIGHGAVVLPGRTVGTGAVVGAGAIVTRDVAPYTIVVGNPARPLRRRFPEPVAERLLALAWWDWDHERLRRALPDFRALPIDAFLERHGA